MNQNEMTGHKVELSFLHFLNETYVGERWKSKLQVVVNVSAEAFDVQRVLWFSFTAKIVARVESKHTGQRHVYKFCFLISEMTLSCRGGAAVGNRSIPSSNHVAPKARAIAAPCL